MTRGVNWTTFLTDSTFRRDNLSALKHLCVGPLHYITLSLVQFQHSKVITFLHLYIMCGSPPPHHFILGSVSLFQSDDLSALKHLCVGPLHYITLSLVQFQHSKVITFLHLYIMCGSPPPHHFILGSVSLFQSDDLSALKHLCVGPLHYITLSLVQFQHSGTPFFT